MITVLRVCSRVVFRMPNPSIITLTALVGLIFLLTPLGRGWAGSGERLSNNGRQGSGANVSSSDIIPGVVVVKLKRSSSASYGPAQHGAAPLSNAFAQKKINYTSIF